MPGGEENSGSSLGATAQPQISQSTMFHQILPPQHLDLKTTGEIAENWKLWKEKYNNYYVISRLERESPEYQLAMFKHAIGDDGLKVIKTFSYSESENANDWRVVLGKMEKHCIGEVNEIYERYCFNKRDKFPTETVENFVAELKTLAKTCNFCDCLRDSLIRDRIVLGIKNEETTKKLLRIRDLTLNKCIDVCRSEEITSMQMKSLSEPVDGVNKVKSRKTKSDKTSDGNAQSNKISCKFCGYEHPLVKKKCPAWGKTCKRCKEKNHFAKKCTRKTSVYNIESEEELEEISVVRIQAVKERAVFAEMLIKQQPVRFQIDCGASANILPLKYAEGEELAPCSQTLVMWNGTRVKPVGTCAMLVVNPKNNEKFKVRFLVVKENLTPLLGLNTTEKMKLLTIHKENFVHVVEKVCDDLLDKYPDVFDKGLGTLPGKVHLQVDPDSKPVILPARKVPVSVREKFKEELRRLESLNVIAPVDQPTEWVSQIVVAVKKSGELRVCIDPKPLNAALKREHYQIPVIDDLLPDLTDARVFTKVDLASAFWHLELDHESSMLTTFATPYGRYRWLRLPFGLSVSSEIFQKRLHQELYGLPGVKCIADDVLIHGTNEADHDSNLEAFMNKCQQKGIKLNSQKLEFKCKEIPFHGHLLTTEGLKPDPEKVRAIVEMPRPEKRDDILRLNGMVNYLSRFLPHLSDVMKPLRDLTHKDAVWCWDDLQEKAWNDIKNLIVSAPLLAYYKPSKVLEIQCDSSQSGLGAALMQDGHPIAYTSRALTETESRYAQIEKEMLAIVFSVEKFNDYTFGRRTIVYTDHKPLQSIVKKPLHRAPKRLQGMMIRLQKYDLEVRYERGNRMFLADTLSRAYLPSCTQVESEFETINMMKYLPISEARLLQIQRETEKDESLQALKAVLQQGWPEDKSALPPVVSPYFNMRDEMSVQDGLIFKGERVVVPKAARGELLRRIHNSHLGVNGCLNRARECLYWPGMTGDIKNHVSTCEACREYERSQSKETLKSHETPSRPWQYVAVDLFELEGKSYLVTSDYFSDFFELDHLRSTSSVHVIKKLKSHFARHGIPEQLVTDNGPQFTSRDFLKFSKEWDFDHRTSSPRYSQSNGKAESAVKEAKKILVKCKKAGSDAYLALLDHRNTPPTGIQISPAQRLLNRRTRSLLPMSAGLLKPSVADEDTTRTKLRLRQQQQAR